MDSMTLAALGDKAAAGRPNERDNGPSHGPELVKELGWPWVDMEVVVPEMAALDLVPAEVAQRHQVLPLEVQGWTLKLVMADPHNLAAIDDVRVLTGMTIEPLLADPLLVRQAIERLYVERLLQTATGAGLEVVTEEDADIADLQKMAREARTVRLVNLILRQALEERASDVHVEPFENALRVRYRIDGILHEVASPPRHLAPAIASRIKIMAELNIAERRLPQDGRIKLRVAGRDVDVRVSTVPTVHGESIVMRLLDPAAARFGLSDLGMGPKDLERFRKLISLPYGIILVTGPTGSGKTTTLYAALQAIYKTEKKIITIEDPVEYQLPGVNQIQVRQRINLTFANGLRSILRQDPDIIMVGEIRDAETAEIAVQAALTGHLVFSTLHTNDAAGAFTRLLDMGIDDYLVASTVQGVVAQRLVRRVCSACAVEAPVKAAGDGDGEDGGEEIRGRQGRGCDACRQTGYRGCIGIFELLAVNDKIRRLVMQRAPAGVIKEAAMADGMATMRQDGLNKVRAGLTTLDEVLRVTQLDQETGSGQVTVGA
ncbi:MAG TPA: type II secretion system ATPase GspE [Firmicutes bacterium]|nr:type II secretion system ATPase GspE [Bacillota bacterium]